MLSFFSLHSFFKNIFIYFIDICIFTYYDRKKAELPVRACQQISPVLFKRKS